MRGVVEKCKVLFGKTVNGGLALLSRIKNTDVVRRFRIDRVVSGKGKAPQFKVNAEILEIKGFDRLKLTVDRLIRRNSEWWKTLIERKAKWWGDLHLVPR